MKLSVFLIILSVHMSMASKESIKLKISNVQEFSKPTTPIDAQIPKKRDLLKKSEKKPNMCLATVENLQLKYDEKILNTMVSKFENILKKIERNPNFGLTICGRRFTIQLSIPYGRKYWYGAQYDYATARKAVVMIVQEYKKSLEAKSPATNEDLQQKYDAMFSKSQKDITVLKFENTLKHIERNPNFGVQKYGTRRYYVHLYIPIGERHLYGSHQDHTTARRAVLMIANEYKKSLEANSPATKEDLQQKYDAMFPLAEIKQQMVILKFDDTLKKIEQNPNFGLKFNGRRIYVNVRIPIGERYLYGHHHEHATARKAVQMIADEYMKSLELETPATFHELKLKYDAMFREAQKEVSKCDCKENKLDIENGKKNLLMIFQITVQKLIQKNEQNDATSSEETDENPSSNKVYKIRRIWNTPEDEPEHDFILGGYFKVMNPPDIFWVNTIKKVDGRLSGYYKKCGGCSGWVNLDYVDSTDFDGPKEVNETLKRKREKSESISESEESTRGSDRISEQHI